MDAGAAIFFTDYSMGPAALGRALEERGFESLWAPEHSHIPLSRASAFPQGGELPKKYYDSWICQEMTLRFAAASSPVTPGYNIRKSFHKGDIVASELIIERTTGVRVRH